MQENSFQPQLPEHPPKAYKNLDFLNSHAARNIRVQCELTEPGVRFREEKIYHTIVMFGSARTPSPETVEQSKNKHPRALHYYESARALAKELTEWSEGLADPKHRLHICSGGGPGIMEAANRGASEGGGRNIGLGISLPFEQSNNSYITPELSFEFHYFFVRKYWFLYQAKAVIVFPGGFGTMDELFEMLTLIQTKKILKPLPIILFGSEFWNDILNFDKFIEWGVISPSDLDLFKILDSVADVKAYLTKEIPRRFFG